MNKWDDPKTTLRRYYTLAHAMTPRKNSPTHGRSAESGDETDRSVENEITESFFMDEINANTESCSLDSSRENLLDGDFGKESRPGSGPNSRPSSGRRPTVKGSKLPVDQRIKILEDGLKEADMEREVVLSCLGKEYLERITMQNYLQEICSKSGYNYDEVVSNIVTQTGAKGILEDIMESRAKGLLITKNSKTEQLIKPQHSIASGSFRGNLQTEKNTGDILNGNERVEGIDFPKEKQLKEFLAQFTEAEIAKVNSAMKRDRDKVESSHTHTTKDVEKLKESSLEEYASKQNISGGSSRGDSKVDKDDIVLLNQSPNDNSKNPWEPHKVISCGIHERSDSQNNGIDIERPVFRVKQKDDSMALRANDKQAKLIMPGKTGSNISQNRSSSILRSLELKGLEASERSIDSIDEGIFMLKRFLHGLQNGKQNVNGNGDSSLHSVAIKTDYGTSYDNEISNGRRRKLSLNESGSERKQSELKPQRRRSYAEGINMNKRVTNDSQTMVQSRLYEPTVASRNKVKNKMSKREFDSDTESGKQSTERKPVSLKRSVSDVRHGPKRHLSSNYTSAEDDSSLDGEERDYSNSNNAFHYIYQVSPEISDREYTKLMGILNMLHEQKMKWDSESRDLNQKLGEERKLRSDLSHDNGVLRKSLEAANHAIKEINSKVQELKLTIVPLREENSKLRDQNQSLKGKFDLLRKDKTLLLQELQELKHTKQRYEERLRILGELYHTNRIKLVVDSNNNNFSAGNIDLTKEDLSELFETDGVVSDDGKVAANKKMGRNRDSSKRHSFHGFEKIEELAGDAEELLAEKEQLELENQSLKEELQEIREKIKADDNKEPEKEDDILNRRKGWRMQREESKQRIIRDILKTESSHVYGRPYASCTNLTLKNESRDNSKSVNQSNAGNECTDVPDSGMEKKSTVGGASFEFDIERKRKTSGEISWKEESEKIKKRLQNCKFEKPVVNKESITKKEAAFNSQDSARNEKNKEARGNDSDNTKAIDLPIRTRRILSEFESENRNWKGPDNPSKDLESVSSDQTTTGTTIDTESKESRRKENDSFASPQWPLVREKIRAIYEQPVEILEQSLYEKKISNCTTKENTDTRKATWDRLQKHRASDDAVLNSNGLPYDQGEMIESRTGVSGYLGRGFQKQSPTNEKKNVASKEDLRKAEASWQRKSASEEIKSYEDYRRKLRREELEAVYLKSNTKNNVNQPAEENQKLSNGQPSKNGKFIETDMTHSIKKEKARYHIEAIGQNDMEYDDQQYIELSEDMPLGQSAGTPWIPVPVYLKDVKRQSSHQTSSTPIRHSQQYFEGRKGFEMGKESKAKGEKESEKTIADVESAFSSTRPSAENRREIEKDSSKLKHNFVRQSSGTIMYLDEIADSDSGSSSEGAKIVPRRRSKSLRRPRPQSEILSSTAYGFEGNESGGFRRNRSLRLPKKTKADMFSVDIFFDGESQDDSAIQMHSQFFNSSSSSTELGKAKCQHQNMHHVANYQQETYGKQRIHSDSGKDVTRYSPRRPKSPGGFSCEMCREISKKKNVEEKYCWEKYFPIGETTIETWVVKEDYV